MIEDLFKDYEHLDFHNPEDFKKYVNTIIELKDSSKDTFFEPMINAFADEAYKVGYEMYDKCQKENQKAKADDTSKEEKEYVERLKKINSEKLSTEQNTYINKLSNEYVETILKPNMKFLNKSYDEKYDKIIDLVSDELRNFLCWILKNK